MYRVNGESIFVVDGHVHFWDGSKENHRNERWAESWIHSFYDLHKLSPEENTWPLEKYRKFSEEDIMHDVFEVGYVDKAILLPVSLNEFYKNGFSTTEGGAALAEKYPGKFIVNGRFDPRDGDEGLKRFAEEVKRYDIKGVKLYTAEWHGDSKGWKLTDPMSKKYLDKCAELGVVNIHVHKGPTIRPLNMDAFDVRDVDEVATEYFDAGLRFIVEHCGLPRLDEFCWIGTQDLNVYGGLSAVMPFIHAKPYYFAECLAEMLFWLGEDRLIFASDYAMWHPKWLIDKFMAFELPEEVKQKVGVDLTLDAKRKILGLNAAALYDIPVPEKAQLPAATGKEVPA
jgi:uncharacterized protein